MDEYAERDKYLLRARDVAAFLGKSQTYVYWLIRRGEIPVLRLGPKAIRIRPEDLSAYQRKRDHGQLE